MARAKRQGCCPQRRLHIRLFTKTRTKQKSEREKGRVPSDHALVSKILCDLCTTCSARQDGDQRLRESRKGQTGRQKKKMIAPTAEHEGGKNPHLHSAQDPFSSSPVPARACAARKVPPPVSSRTECGNKEGLRQRGGQGTRVIHSITYVNASGCVNRPRRRQSEAGGPCTACPNSNHPACPGSGSPARGCRRRPCASPSWAASWLGRGIGKG